MAGIGDIPPWARKMAYAGVAGLGLLFVVETFGGSGDPTPARPEPMPATSAAAPQVGRVACLENTQFDAYKATDPAQVYGIWNNFVLTPHDTSPAIRPLHLKIDEAGFIVPGGNQQDQEFAWRILQLYNCPRG